MLRGLGSIGNGNGKNQPLKDLGNFLFLSVTWRLSTKAKALSFIETTSGGNQLKVFIVLLREIGAVFQPFRIHIILWYIRLI